MTEEKTRFRFSAAVAKTVRAQRGAFAHLYALEMMEALKDNDVRQLWLDVLAELDELDETGRKDDETPRI